MEEQSLALLVKLIEEDTDTALSVPPQMTEEDLVHILADCLRPLMEERMEYLMHLLYRMDVKEWRAKRAVSPYNTEPANVGLARVIIAREKQRLATRMQYPPKPIDDDLAW